MITPEQEAAAELKRVIVYLETLGDKDEKELWKLMDDDPVEYARLLVAVGSLATKAAGSLSKLYEKVTALELTSQYDTEKYEVRHIAHSYGADVCIINRETKEEECIEVKHSMTTKGKHYHTNWNFTVDDKLLLACKREPTNTEHIASLINSIYRKQHNGVCYLASRSGKDSLQHYEVSGAFISLYCVKKVLATFTKTVNLGCDRCILCNHYHRIVHLAQWGRILEKRILASGETFAHNLNYFSIVEWSRIMSPVPSKNRCFIYAVDLPHNVEK